MSINWDQTSKDVTGGINVLGDAINAWKAQIDGDKKTALGVAAAVSPVSPLTAPAAPVAPSGWTTEQQVLGVVVVLGLGYLLTRR